MALRVLLVDDNQDFLVAATRLLEAQGLAVVGTAGDATSARQLNRSLRPDVALVDVKLGTDSGIDLAHRLASDTSGSGPQVVLISTHTAEDFMELIEASPAVGFVAKSELSLTALLRVLGRTQA